MPINSYPLTENFLPAILQTFSNLSQRLSNISSAASKSSFPSMARYVMSCFFSSSKYSSRNPLIKNDCSLWRSHCFGNISPPFTMTLISFSMATSRIFLYFFLSPCKSVTYNIFISLSTPFNTAFLPNHS